MQRFRPCNLCADHRAGVKFSKDNFSIVQCPGCGLVYVGEDPAEIDFENLYGESYYKGGDDKVFADYLGQEGERRAAARRKLWGLKRLVPSGRLLDVGCAAGFFLVEAAAAYDVEGVELSAFSSRFAREHFGLKVTTGALAEARFPSGRFDVITLWDVIEHVPNPLAVLSEASRLLRPGGHLVLTTGDIDSSLAKAKGADWSLMGPPWHLYYFSKATMSRMAQGAGLQVKSFAAHGEVTDLPVLRHRVFRLIANAVGSGDIMQATLVKVGT
jgi:SAM-dependent methyltransferase